MNVTAQSIIFPVYSSYYEDLNWCAVVQGDCYVTIIYGVPPMAFESFSLVSVLVIFTAGKRSFGNVMFSQASVHRGLPSYMFIPFSNTVTW